MFSQIHFYVSFMREIDLEVLSKLHFFFVTAFNGPPMPIFLRIFFFTTISHGMRNYDFN